MISDAANWFPADTAPKDGSAFVALVERILWQSGKVEHGAIAEVRWNGARWELVGFFGQDVDVVLSRWKPQK